VNEEVTDQASPMACVSVLIVNYKVYDELTACIAALAPNLSDGRTEAIVVDHESEPARRAAFSSAYPHVQLIARADNRGFGAGINLAARSARGKYFLILNPDTRVLPGAIDTLCTFLDAHAEVVAAGPRIVYPDMRPQPSGRRFPSAVTGLFGRTSFLTRMWPNNPISRRDLPSRDAAEGPLDVDWITGTCLMIRADAFRDAGGFDERFFLYWEDADLCQRLRRAGGRIVYLPDATVVHAAGRSSDRALVRSIVAFHRSAFRYYARYHRGPTRIVALPFAAAGLSLRTLVRLAAIPLRRAATATDVKPPRS
jgi:GT2 family glycosyltransferase